MILLVLQTLILVAGLSLFGQFIVGMFNWRRRHDNFIYQLFGILTGPVVRLVRVVTPRVVLDQHVPVVAFLLLLFGYLVVGLWHRDVCADNPAAAGCERWAAAWRESPR